MHPKDSDQTTVGMMRRILQAHGRLFVEAGATITRQQAVVIEAVLGNPSAPQLRLTELTGIDRSTLSQIIYSMIVNGLARKQRDDDDRRANIITITEEGRAAFRKDRKRYEQAEESVLSALSAPAREAFKAMLQKIVTHDKEKEEDHAHNRKARNLRHSRGHLSR